MDRKEKSAVIVTVAIIFLVYIGILSSWIHAGLIGQAEISSYYDMLSRGFAKGQPSLLEAPSQSLLSLADPYDPMQNHGLRLNDVSLYKGKYYLYWGPVPAGLFLIFHLFTSQPFSDAILVWFALSGLLISNVAIILWIKHRFWDELPGWYVILSILIIGLSNPIPWLLGRPLVYEAAIAGGQFFLMTGIYWALTGLEGPVPNRLRLFLASLFWAFAIGTRFSLLFAVFFLVIFCLFLLFYTQEPNPNKNNSSTKALVALLTPLVVMLGLLGLYNYFRFGSFFEFGLQYQLSVTYVHKIYAEHLVTSINYLIPSFYNYVLLPFGGLAKGYPFIKLLPANNPAYHGPAFTFESLIGFIWSAPFVIFSLIPIAFGSMQALRLRSFSKGLILNRFKNPGSNRKSGLTWFPFLIGGTAIFGFLPLLFYFFGTIRFQMDFMPSLLLLSIYGLGTGLRASSSKPVTRRILVVSAFSLSILSILLGILLGINSSFLQLCAYVSSQVCHY